MDFPFLVYVFGGLSTSLNVDFFSLYMRYLSILTVHNANVYFLRTPI